VLFLSMVECSWLLAFVIDGIEGTDEEKVL
jgi:hypothetical protein